MNTLITQTLQTMNPIRTYSFTAMLASLLFVACSGDPCETSMCHNGGVCIDGLCDCPDRYTGPQCDEQVTPDVMRITSVELLRFPGFTPNSDKPWDAEDGPDVFFKLVHDDHPVAQPVVLVENADHTQRYDFHISIVDMNAVLDEYTMQLFDYEAIGVEPQFMGEIAFTPYHSTNGFPTEIHLDNGGPVAFRMTVEYLYRHDD
jgi:hypothetical protein